MGFTDGLTFIEFNLLLTTPGNPATGQIIRGHFHSHLVTGQNPDEIHSELSGNMRQNRVSISNVDLECGVGQGLDDHALNFDHIGFCQVLIPPGLDYRRSLRQWLYEAHYS